MEKDIEESKQRERDSIVVLKKLMSPSTDEAKAKALYLRNCELHKMDEVSSRQVRWGTEDGKGIDMEINAEGTMTSETTTEVTEKDQLPTQIEEQISVIPREEEPLIKEVQQEIMATRPATELLQTTELETTPKMQEIQADQTCIEEIKVKGEELEAQKAKICSKTTEIEEKEADLGSFLQTKAENLLKEKEEREPHVKPGECICSYFVYILRLL